METAVALVTAGLALAAAVAALTGPRRASLPATKEEPPEPQRRRPLTATQYALTLVTAGVAIATAMLALAGSARASSPVILPEDGPYVQAPSIAIPYVPVVRDATRQPSTSPTPTPTPDPTPAAPAPFMPMPVEGLWRVTSGYRCGVHDEEHISTFALDIMLAEGKTAGQPVHSPVRGRVITVEDSTTFFCGDAEIEGPKSGAVIIIDFRTPSGPAQRLRLAHIDPATVPDELRPDGRPVAVEAGAPLGSVADVDRCSHLHVSLTRLEGGRELPEPLVIEGTLLEDCEGDDCWGGALIPPEDR